MGEFEELSEVPQVHQQYYGKYRAWVTDNVDPEQLGRIRVRVPEVTGDYDEWAVPAWPPGSTPEQHHAPEVGSEVWVEFEHGDASRPIWDGLVS